MDPHKKKQLFAVNACNKLSFQGGEAGQMNRLIHSDGWPDVLIIDYRLIVIVDYVDLAINYKNLFKWLLDSDKGWSDDESVCDYWSENFKIWSE